MKSTIFAVAAFAAAVSAQTSSVCLAQPILEQCLVTTQYYLELCTSTDYACLCEKYTSILTCFDNCPNDSRESGASQQKQLNCMNASVYSSLSATTTSTSPGTSAVAATTTTTGTSTSTRASTTSTSGPTGTSTSTSSASTSSQSNAAGEHAIGGSGMFAAIAAVAALL
ncbi:hypothetical protein BKA67DRAFT_659335 [Truncatella angustata]|uniref:GPI anchored serine-threonine rich protein n=1 Tax=Truncatella angustata TaxID=152316 RepID=A0A9P8UIA6_9PEZI|nr:uncharacterized protein BKA67DRAFT_659335 [Truncatella angustata]KAH6652641.1 hypothetical protein BKA67DRAFT_659335 [Truncatella angustata]KAH8196861.1 hypothetical protein TruAng_008974 [Truncatella angustata]